MEGGTSALKLTMASYWRPNGHNIHRFPDSKDEDDWGVKPNPGYEVKLSDEERLEYFKWRRDRDIVRRPGQETPKHETSEKKDDAAKKDAAKKKEPFRDRVLDKALEYIKGELQKQNKDARAPGQIIPNAALPVQEEIIDGAASLTPALNPATLRARAGCHAYAAAVQRQRQYNVTA
jgi:carboxyl-terminal processing protease